MEKENIRVRNLRKKMGILPSVKRINTIASEHPELTNYLYLTYDGSSHDITYYPNEKNVIILGSGAIESVRPSNSTGVRSMQHRQHAN